MLKFGQLARPFRYLWSKTHPLLPELNFITIHYAYFIGTSLVTAVIFWASATPLHSVAFIDAFFLTTSAMTEAGLNSVNLSELNTWQQIMLFVLILMGSSIFVSAFIVFVRLSYFEDSFVQLKQRMKQRQLERQRKKSTSNPRAQAQWRKAAGGVMSLSRMRGPSWSYSVQSKKAEGENSSVQQQGTDTEKHPEIVEDKNKEQDWRDSPTVQHGPDADANADTDADEERDVVPPLPSAEYGPILQTNGSPTQAKNIRLQIPNTPAFGVKRSGTFGSIQSRSDEEYGKIHRPLVSFTGVGATSGATLRNSRSISSPRIALSHVGSYGLPQPETPKPAVEPIYGKKIDKYIESAKGFIARNSQYNDLTLEERKDLGGYEYRAVLFLAFLVPFYFFIWQLLGAIALGAWVANYRASTTYENGANPWWTGIFNAVSAFNNSGMSLLDANMVAFQDSVFMLLSMGLFILAGNTAYPIFLRLSIWVIRKALRGPRWQKTRDTLDFLLEHPRRCYTNLFPSRHTWWLGFTLVALNGTDWALFEILNIGNSKITQLHTGIEVVDGLFQALAVRSGGFYVVPIPNLRISLQVLYVLMMYISVYPVTITMRNSNVYEERSLGIEDDGDDQMMGGVAARVNSNPLSPGGSLLQRAKTFTQAPARDANTYFIRQQVRAQLAHDAWFVAAAVFLIMIIEGAQFETDPVSFSVFNVLFEVVSAYATVGMSVGVPNNAYSFSGSWHKLSKLILIFVMLRGRHRGLPVAIDHAVQLPSEKLAAAEEEIGQLRKDRIERRATALEKMISPV